MEKEDLQKEDLQKEDLQKEDLQKEDLQKEELQKEDLQKEELQKEDLQKEYLQKEHIIREISVFEKAVENGTAEINIMLVDQSNQRKKRYRGLMIKTKLEDVKSALMDSCAFLRDELDKRILDAYDLEISVDDTVQIVGEEDVIYSKEILSEITVDYTDDNVVSENTDLSKIKFMVIQVNANDKSIYLFKKYIHPSTAYKTSQKYVFSGGLLKPFTDKVITINSSVDALLLEKFYYIFNRNAFNSMFAYKDAFVNMLKDNRKIICDSELLKDADKFIADCEADGRYLTRLAKVIVAKGFTEVKEKKNEIPNVIKKFNLNLEMSQDGKIAYSGKKDIPEILNLLLRHYVIDALTDHKMIAAAIQEYQVGAKGGDKQ